MNITFDYQEMPNWPALAWLAACESGKSSLKVWHGTQVETRSDWFCEAVWDSTFCEGGFDSTDLVFGSGGRRRAERVTFVSSGTTVDRLQYLEHVRR